MYDYKQQCKEALLYCFVFLPETFYTEIFNIITKGYKAEDYFLEKNKQILFIMDKFFKHNVKSYVDKSVEEAEDVRL